ncbi:GNAT family N-acetyltransferase [Rhodoferax sp.]|uniref:GNAT family N-acetyltransferase n=1 Tax=Rhodoferax sp. TaxID=50421 RepID=UPI0027488203|nr:GNAT family N-acetyltransferase [Rhodoferax sp.]
MNARCQHATARGQASITPSLAAVTADDFEAMLAIRIDALRESLERLGRFDPARARERLAAGFAPEYMRHIVIDGERVGFITLRPQPDSAPAVLQIDHLYIRPQHQGRQIGAWALDWAKAQAAALGCDITLSALKQSAANRFYLRHGFVQITESDFDVGYRWTARTEEPV